MPPRLPTFGQQYICGRQRRPVTRFLGWHAQQRATFMSSPADSLTSVFRPSLVRRYTPCIQSGCVSMFQPISPSMMSTIAAVMIHIARISDFSLFILFIFYLFFFMHVFLLSDDPSNVTFSALNFILLVTFLTRFLNVTF